MITRAIIVLLFSFMITFLLPDAMAQVPIFDQTTYVYEHSAILTINDSEATSNPITVEITAWNEEIVKAFLYQTNNPNIYKSNLIYLSQEAENRDGEFPVIKLGDLRTIDVRYVDESNNVFSADAPIEPTSERLENGTDYFDTPDVFTMENYPECPEGGTFGGDDDKDYICDFWETGDRMIKLQNGLSNYTLPPCDDSIDYSSDKLGKRVCPELGVKDIYIEIDYLKNHSPNVEALEKVVESFRNAPVENYDDDGNPHEKYPTGINLHVFIDYEINHVNQIHFDETQEGGFHDIKARDYGLSNATSPPEQTDGIWKNPHNKMAKAQVFYYYIWAHEQTLESDSSGIAEQNGNDGSITLGKFVGGVGNMDQQAGTFMHELGHNIGLNHGGGSDDANNCKPNLLSVMTYSRQFSDLMERPLDYSRKSVGTMENPDSLGNEKDLFESGAGISGYPNCPFVSTTNVNDLDFDGVPDVCDVETEITSDTVVLENVSLFGNLTIKKDAVLTIEDGVTLEFNPVKNRILVESEGGLLIKQGGKIFGNSELDKPENSEDSPVVFGESVEMGLVMVEDSNQMEIPWPENWKNLRFIKDQFGDYVCPLPDGQNLGNLQAIELDGANQWELIDLSRKNEQWQNGRPLNLPEVKSTNSDNPKEIINFTSTFSTINPTLNESSENVTITIKPGSGIGKISEEKQNCNSWFCPSYVRINADTKVIWINEDETESHSITSASWDNPNSKPKFDYQGEFNNHIFMKEQTFEHTFENDGIYQYGCIYHPWMKGIICVGPDCSISGEEEGGTTHEEGDFSDRFDKDGKWCISKKEAQKQKDNNPNLDMNRAPLCSNSELSEEKELTVGNVLSSRLVNVDNLRKMIGQLKVDDDDGEINGTGIGILQRELTEIEKLVKKDKMPEALEGYLNFKDSVNVLVSSETKKDQILKVVDRNIETTTMAIPEFETVSILVLIISTLTIIVMSRKTSFNSINSKSI